MEFRMKKNLNVKKQKGFSLIEALMAVAILGISVSFVGINMLNQTQMQKSNEAIFSQKEFISEVVDDLSFPHECQKLLIPSMGDPDKVTLKVFGVPAKDVTISKSLFSTRYNNQYFTVDEVRLTLNQVSTSAYEYSGFIKIKLKARPDYEDKILMTKDAEVPVQLYAEDIEDELKYVTCFNNSNEIMQARAEMCSLFGGQLVGGKKCQFYRTRRPSAGGGSNPQATDLLETNPNAKVQYFDFQDQLCYLDSLITRIPGLDDATMQVYTTDSYNKVRRTTSCRYPGYIKASGRITPANRATIIADNINTTSISVRDIFTEDGAPPVGGGSGGGNSGGGGGCRKCGHDSNEIYER